MQNFLESWFYAADGNAVGPISKGELFAYLREKGADVLVWHDGQKGWQRASEIPQLAPPKRPESAPTPPSEFVEQQVRQPHSSRRSSSLGGSISVAMQIVSLPIMFLNVFGGLVGAVWLLFAGEWRLVLLSFVSTAASSLVIGILLLPALAFGAPAPFLFERGKLAQCVGAFLAFLGGAWIYVVMAVWCWFCFSVTVGYHISGSVLPYLLWAYTVATGPWGYMAKQEALADPNAFSPMAAFWPECRRGQYDVGSPLQRAAIVLAVGDGSRAPTHGSFELPNSGGDFNDVCK